MMYQFYLPASQAPALYAYYVFSSLLVITLVISLIRLPFIHLIAEVNTIISNLLIYINKELLGGSDSLCLNELALFFKSQEALLLISLLTVMYLLYLALADFLLFADTYFCNLQSHSAEKLKLKFKNYGPPRKYRATLGNTTNDVNNK